MRNRTEDQIDFYLIRHGATAANEEHRYLGRTEQPLSEKGREALKKHAAHGCYPVAEQVLCSPMERCRESAGILYPLQALVEVPEWCEMDFGAFEMKNYADLNGNADYQSWIDSGGTTGFPGGESREVFVRRVVFGMENAAEYLGELLAQQFCRDCGGCMPGLRVAAVVHGGTIMALLSHYCGGDYFDYQVGPGEGYHCRLRLRGESIEMEIAGKL